MYVFTNTTKHLLRQMFRFLLIVIVLQFIFVNSQNLGSIYNIESDCVSAYTSTTFCNQLNTNQAAFSSVYNVSNIALNNTVGFIAYTSTTPLNIPAIVINLVANTSITPFNQSQNDVRLGAIGIQGVSYNTGGCFITSFDLIFYAFQPFTGLANRQNFSTGYTVTNTSSSSAQAAAVLLTQYIIFNQYLDTTGQLLITNIQGFCYNLGSTAFGVRLAFYRPAVGITSAAPPTTAPPLTTSAPTVQPPITSGLLKSNFGSLSLTSSVATPYRSVGNLTLNATEGFYDVSTNNDIFTITLPSVVTLSTIAIQGTSHVPFFNDTTNEGCFVRYFTISNGTQSVFVSTDGAFGSLAYNQYYLQFDTIYYFSLGSLTGSTFNISGFVGGCTFGLVGNTLTPLTTGSMNIGGFYGFRFDVYNSTALPTTVPPTTVPPTTVPPTTVTPTTIAPTTITPTTIAPTTVVPTTLTPTTIAQTTIAPTTVVPTTVNPTTILPTTVVPTTTAATTATPTTVIPTTLLATTVHATTLPVTTIQPTTSTNATIAVQDSSPSWHDFSNPDSTGYVVIAVAIIIVIAVVCSVLIVFCLYWTFNKCFRDNKITPEKYKNTELFDAVVMSGKAGYKLLAKV